MKKLLLPFALGIVVMVGLGAGVKISDLALSTSPSTNSFLEIADLNATGTNKSAKILYTNLVTKSQFNNLTGGLIMTGTPAVGDVAAAADTTGTNGVWSAPLWTANSYGTAWLTNSANDDLFLGTLGTSPVLDTIQQRNYFLGSRILNNATVANLSDSLIVGALPGNGATINNGSFLFGFGDEPFKSANISGNDIYSYGSSSLRGTTTTNNASYIFGYGDDALSQAFLTGGSSDIFGYGYSAVRGAVLESSYNIYGFGQALRNSRLTNSSDIYGIGEGAGLGLTGDSLSHIFIAGSGGVATNSNDWVAGDASYNYKFPGASAAFAGPMTVNDTVYASAFVVTGSSPESAFDTISVTNTISVGSTNTWKLGAVTAGTNLTVIVNGVTYKLATVP